MRTTALALTLSLSSPRTTSPRAPSRRRLSCCPLFGSYPIPLLHPWHLPASSASVSLFLSMSRAWETVGALRASLNSGEHLRMSSLNVDSPSQWPRLRYEARVLPLRF